VAAARAGRAPVALVAASGADPFGTALRDALGSERLDLRFVKIVQDMATGVALIMVDDRGENLISVAPGANAALSPQDVAALPDELFRSARVLLTVLESPRDTAAAALRRARDAGLLTLLNPAPAPEGLPPDLLGLIDVITPNQGEAQALTGVHVKDATSAAAAGRRLQSLGCRAGIVTLGAAGCVVVDRDVDVIPARPVIVRDTTAAGDAFTGALAVALAEGKALSDAARWATAAAALCVTRPGAQPSLPARDQIDALDAMPCP
jgi:ribokinase